MTPGPQKIFNTREKKARKESLKQKNGGKKFGVTLRARGNSES